MIEPSIDFHNITELRCKTTCYLGLGAIQKFDPICAELKTQGIDRVIIIASRSAYKKCGAWDVMTPIFHKYDIDTLVYDRITPNPDNIHVDEAAALARAFGAQAVIGVGGGSPIDAAKSVAILLAYPEYNCLELFDYAFTPTNALPHVAINTTHGTGTEVDRFAVVSIPELGYKPAIAYDCIYPLYAIDDPALMTMLPADQTLYVTIDALCHATEAATSQLASPYTILLAREAIRLVVEYLPLALANGNDLEARYYLLYASAIAGICFDNGMLHFTHALEHPLSAVKPDLPHGLGLAMVLPAVLETIYPVCAPVLAELYAPILEGIATTGSADASHHLACGVEEWLADLGISEKLFQQGFAHKDLDWLTRLTQDTPSLGLLLSLAPIDATPAVIRSIYERSLYPIRQPSMPVAA